MSAMLPPGPGGPDLSALLGGGGPSGPPAPPVGAPPAGGDDADSLLQTAIDALREYVAHAGSDDVDTATAAQCLAKLQQIKAQDQKNSEAAMGTQPAHKAMGKVAARLASQQ